MINPPLDLNNMVNPLEQIDPMTLLSEEQKQELLDKIDQKQRELDNRNSQFANWMKPLINSYATTMKESKIINEEIKKALDITATTIKPDTVTKEAIFLEQLHKTFSTLHAHVTSSIFSNYDSSFDLMINDPMTQQTNGLDLSTHEKAMKDAYITKFRDINLEKLIGEFVYRVLLDGEAGWLYYYDKKSFSFPDEQGQIQEKVQFEGINLTVVEQQDLFYDPTLAKRQPENYNIFVRSYKTWNEIKNNELYKDYITPESEVYKSLEGGAYLNYLEDSTDFKYDSDYKDRKMCEIFEFYGDYYDESTKTHYDNILITIVNKQFVIRWEPNPFGIKPIFIYRDTRMLVKTRRPHSFFASIFQRCTKTKELVQLYEFAVAMQSNPAYFVKRGTFSEEQPKILPGKMIYVNPAAAEEFKPQPIVITMPANITNYLQQIQDEVQDISGTYQNMMGNTDSTNRTATEITAVTDGASKRLNLFINSLNNEMKIPLIQNYILLDTSFVKKPTIVRIPTMDGIQLFPIQSYLYPQPIKVYVGDKDDAQAKTQNFKEALPLLQSILTIPQMAASLNPLETLKWVLSNMDIRDPETLLVPPPPPMMPGMEQQVPQEQPPIPQGPPQGLPPPLPSINTPLPGAPMPYGNNMLPPIQGVGAPIPIKQILSGGV